MRKRRTWKSTKPLPAKAPKLTTDEVNTILHSLDWAAGVAEDVLRKADLSFAPMGTVGRIRELIYRLDHSADFIELAFFGPESVQKRMTEHGIKKDVKKGRRLTAWARILRVK